MTSNTADHPLDTGDIGLPPVADSTVETPLLIVTGMHRSGTSMAASMLQSLGVHMGERMVPADAGNPRGYFEATDFLELNRAALEQCILESDGGHRDWGWTESETFDRTGLGALDRAARDLVASRMDLPGPQGFKDPRSSLLLDFWDTVVPEARYLLLYRYPWDVADSMQRLGAEVFLEHPEYAYRIWGFYNRHLLDFYRRHADRAALVSTNALVRRPESLGDLLREKLGIVGLESEESPSFEDLVDTEHLFTTLEGEDPLIGLVGAASPDCLDLLRDLDHHADLSSSDLWTDPGCRSQWVLDPGSPEGPEVTLSVVIPCFDHGQFLLEAVASVERCGLERDGDACVAELIIVNDGSSEPRTLDILEILRRAGYRVIDQANQGLSAARNRGIEAARGRYILPLDADNRLRPGFPGAASRLLDATPEVAVAYGDCHEFGQRNGRRSVARADLPRMLWGNYIDACTVFRRELWVDVGGFDTGLPAWEDWEFWIHALAKGWRFHRLEGITFDYRVCPNSLVRSVEDEAVKDSILRHIVTKHRSTFDAFLVRQLGMDVSRPSGLETELSRLRLETHGLEEDLAQYRRWLEIRGEEVAVLNTQLAAKVDEVTSLDGQLDVWVKKAGDLDGRVVELEGELGVWVKKAGDLEGRVVELEGELGVWVEKAGDSSGRVEELDRDLAVWVKKAGDLDRRLQDRDRELQDRDRELHERSVQLQDREREVMAWEKQVQGQEARASELEGSLAEAKAHAEEMHRQTEALHRQMHGYRTTLEQIHASRLWRLISALWVGIDWVLPRESRRRRAYDGLVRWVRGGG